MWHILGIIVDVVVVTGVVIAIIVVGFNLIMKSGDEP